MVSMLQTPASGSPRANGFSGFVLLQGIETVRRDGCPALVKMMEKSLRLLFTSRDLSQV